MKVVMSLLLKCLLICICLRGPMWGYMRMEVTERLWVLVFAFHISWVLGIWTWVKLGHLVSFPTSSSPLTTMVSSSSFPMAKDQRINNYLRVVVLYMRRDLRSMATQQSGRNCAWSLLAHTKRCREVRSSSTKSSGIVMDKCFLPHSRVSTVA